MGFSEKRKYPRAQESVSCQVAVGENSFQAETRNISCGGALCRFSHEVAPLTKLEMELQLPVSDQSAPAAPIRCVGIVVRQEPAQEGSSGHSFLTAIFFSELGQEDRRRIAEFVLRSMMIRDRRQAS